MVSRYGIFNNAASLSGGRLIDFVLPVLLLERFRVDLEPGALACSFFVIRWGKNIHQLGEFTGLESMDVTRLGG